MFLVFYDRIYERDLHSDKLHKHPEILTPYNPFKLTLNDLNNNVLSINRPIL